MKHVGDITKIQGFTLPRTDVVTGGSPCQDLSVAGKRAGLKHEDMGDEETTRSGLYMEQIRVIKEMRENDQLINGTEGADIRPRYMVWENVPGAFSSNKGEDFRAVLEEAAKVCDETATIPGPDKGKWHNSGAIVGDGWSIAWRVFDAQFWGVPQRRRRIYLVADFGGSSAPEILFKREGLPGYPAPSRIEGQGTTADSQGSLDEAGWVDGRGRYGELVGVDCYNQTTTGDVAKSLNAAASDSDHVPCVLEPFVKSRRAKFQGDFETWVEGEVNPTLNLFDMGDVRTTTAVVAIENHPADSRVTVDDSGTVQTLTSRMGTGGGNVPMTMQLRSGKEGGGKGPLIQENLSATLMAGNGQTLFEPIAYGMSSYASNAMLSDNPHSGVYEAETSRTLDLNGGNPACNQGGIMIVDQGGGKSGCNVSEDITPTLTCTHGGEPVFLEPTYCLQGSMIGREEKNGPQGDGINEDTSFTLNTIDRHAVYSIDRESFSAGVNFPRTPGISDDGTVPTLVSAGPGAVAEIPTYSSSKASFFTLSEKELANTLVATDYKDPPLINTDGSGANNQSVRRLTPLECERLQGYPDGWTDIQSLPEDMDFWREVWGTYADINGTAVKTDAAIKKWLKAVTSDSAQYKALGNSVALPNVYYVLYGIAEQLGFEGTIGSLFDGIGGFPTCWENICGEGTALWASEVEPFPIAVTMSRFGGDMV